jgi:Zn-dependent peptidase ImmA (M78 family)
MWKLAAHLGIDLIALSKAGLDNYAVAYFLGQGRGEFSAVTVLVPHRQIVYNDRHASARISSDVAHELAHALLLHPPAPPLTLDGQRNWDSATEREADELAGHLLVPNPAARRIAARGLDPAATAEVYGVSEKMMAWRLRVSGGQIIARRARDRYKNALAAGRR